MKTAVKISLIVLTVAAVAYAILHFTQKLNGIDDRTMASVPFERYIAEQVQSEIKEHSFDEARDAYNEIMGTITTEASVTTADGKRLISADEERKCREIAFLEYAPIFTEYGISYFNSSTWHPDELEYLGSEVERLQSMRIAEAGSRVASQLQTISQTLDKQKKAWEVVSSAGGCSSYTAVERVIRQSKSFLIEPLTNWRELREALNGVPETARQGYAASVERQAYRVCDNYYRFPTYAEANQSVQSASNLIDEYGRHYTLTPNMRQYRSKLSDLSNLSELDFIHHGRGYQIGVRNPDSSR